jgi:hypothetical protein
MSKNNIEGKFKLPVDIMIGGEHNIYGSQSIMFEGRWRKMDGFEKNNAEKIYVWGNLAQ